MIYIFGAAFDPPHSGHSAIIRALLHYRNPEKIIIIPSGKRNDKDYNVSNEYRKKMCDIFVEEIGDSRVFADYYFIDIFTDEMITRDVDIYAQEKYGDDIVHVFGTDTIASMPSWDEEQYAAKQIKKIFIPRGVSHCEEYNDEAIQKNKNESFLGLDCHALLAMTKQLGIQNYDFFTDSHIPDISSTEIRKIIPEYTTLKHLFDENPKFIIPGLSKRISRYILEGRLYRKMSIGIEKVHRKENNFATETKEQNTNLGLCTMSKPRVLVHVCCGPDVTMPILQLRDEYDVICFWYDPNIQPKEEYDKRYEAFVKICEIEKIPYIKGAYDVKHFFRRIRGLEHTPEKGEKCTNCYDMRMYVAAKLAAKLKIPYYTSSLNTSPKKDLEKLFKIGKEYAEKFHLEFLDIPFRKRGGFEKSVEYTREHGIYRQNYCGCVYSIRENGGSSVG